jgi:hypothetical protein
MRPDGPDREIGGYRYVYRSGAPLSEAVSLLADSLSIPTGERNGGSSLQ